MFDPLSPLEVDFMKNLTLGVLAIGCLFDKVARCCHFVTGFGSSGMGGVAACHT